MLKGVNKIELLKYTFLRHFKVLTLSLLGIMGLMSKCTDNRLELNKQGYFEGSSRECIIKYATQEGENNDRYVLGLESDGRCFELDVTRSTYFDAKNRIGGKIYFILSDADIKGYEPVYECILSVSILFYLLALMIHYGDYETTIEDNNHGYYLKEMDYAVGRIVLLMLSVLAIYGIVNLIVALK